MILDSGLKSQVLEDGDTRYYEDARALSTPEGDIQTLPCSLFGIIEQRPNRKIKLSGKDITPV